MREGTIEWDDEIVNRIDEIEMLLEKAPCVGALVDWPTLKRIREIKEERQLIRYNISLACGSSECDAALAFTL